MKVLFNVCLINSVNSLKAIESLSVASVLQEYSACNGKVKFLMWV